MKKNILFLTMLLMQISIYVNAQSQYINNANNGIHVRGGSSDQTSASSNIGTNCQATGLNSFAAGEESVALGTNSFALGTYCKSLESNAFAFGDYVHAEKTNSMALGAYVKALESNCMVIGMGHNYLNPLSCSTAGVAMGVNSTIPTLFISKANGNYRTGCVAIGNTTNPQTKLHIVADYNEDASIFLQPTNLEKQTSYIKLTDDNHKLLVSEDGCMHLLSLNKNFRLSSRNASITNGEFSLGSTSDRKINIMTTSFPAFYANAYRTGNSYICYQHGASYAIEFNNNAMLFRTAYTENNSRIMEINGWRDPLCLKTNGSIVMNGKVGINRENTTSDYTLAVNGGIITTKVFIQDVENWPDYVFDANYKLMSLEDLKKFIVENKHLPEVPSESELAGEGYDMQEMQQAMMKKIEELTLYTLQQQEVIERLERRINELEGK